MGDVLRTISKQTGLSFKRIDETIYVRRSGVKNATVDEVVVQEIISGTVTDENGDPLPGATILEKGTSNGTTTDIDGRYNLECSDDATLIISFVGYQSTEVSVSGRSSIDISLSLDVSSLEEVVVVGFGTQKEKDVTGSIGSVKGDVLNQLPAPSLEQTLSGRVAGVQVISGSGTPGSGASIRVRGVGTLNNNEPLYVIDGVILGNVGGGGQGDVSPLSLINPNDIESIDILKDASASAIYGARAGNGVVIITTKRGKGDKINVSYDGYTSVYVMDNSKYNMMTGQQWAQFYDQTQTNTGNTSYEGQAFLQRVIAGEDIPSYDWLDELMDNGTAQSHNLSVSGGNETSNYFSSISYFNQDGIITNSGLERYTARLNSDHKINRIKIGNTLLVSHTKTNTRGNVYGFDNTEDWLNRALRVSPLKPIYGPDGYYAGIDDHDPDAGVLFDQENAHPIAAVKDHTEVDQTSRILGSIYGDIELIEGLTFHTMGSIDYRLVRREERRPENFIEGNMAATLDNTRLRINYNERRAWFVENTLTYNESFSDHSITALLGYQAQNSVSRSLQTEDGGFANTQFWFFDDAPHLQQEVLDGDGNVILTLPLVQQTIANGLSEQAFVSVFARLNYAYKDKYLLTATVRRDGSSKFGIDKRWGTFPALSVGWRISEEPFLQNVNWVYDLKLRGGYGISGSDNVNNYAYSSEVGAEGEYNYAFNEGETSGASISQLANPSLRWEQVIMTNVAVDASFLKGRVDVTLEYYNKETTDLFLPYAPAREAGIDTNASGNLGGVSNKGIDFSTTTYNLVGPLSWTSSFNLSVVKNKVLSLPENDDRFSNVNITRVGNEIGALYGYVVDGLFQNWDEVYAHAYQNQATTGFDIDGSPIYDTSARDVLTGYAFTAPGDIRYMDLNGDGIIDPENDRTIIGSTIPDFTWNISNTLSYKGISLSFLFQGVHGVNIYNNLRSSGERSSGSTNKRAILLDSWSGEGSSTTVPRALDADPNNNGRTSTRWLENGSYVRLKNMRLGYDLPRGIVQKIGLNQFQLYLTATNLLTFTDYQGYDPEVGVRSTGDNEQAGTDNGTYPLTRQFTLGLKLNF